WSLPSRTASRRGRCAWSTLLGKRATRSCRWGWSSIGSTSSCRRSSPAHRRADMRKITEHVFAEIYFWGCNPGFVTTRDGVFMIDTPQQPIDAVRWRERIAEHVPIRHLVNTEPHQDHIRGNAYFPGVEVIGQELMVQRYADMLPTITGDAILETL